MNKADLSARIADLAGLTVQDASRAVDATVDVLEQTLASGQQVVLSGFGKFHVIERAERLGVNPRTGESIIVPEHHVPRFTAGTRFKERVRAEYDSYAPSD